MDEPTKQFARKIEDFVCGHCGRAVAGNGFTNHCPACLYSQHVDVMPGDRAAQCGGLMLPVRVEPFGQSWKILHRCLRCGHEKKNQTAPNDDFEVLLRIIDQETKTN